MQRKFKPMPFGPLIDVLYKCARFIDRYDAVEDSEFVRPQIDALLRECEDKALSLMQDRETLTDRVPHAILSRLGDAVSNIAVRRHWVNEGPAGPHLEYVVFDKDAIPQRGCHPQIAGSKLDDLNVAELTLPMLCDRCFAKPTSSVYDAVMRVAYLLAKEKGLTVYSTNEELCELFKWNKVSTKKNSQSLSDQ